MKAENRGATRSDVTVSSSYGERSSIVHGCIVMRELMARWGRRGAQAGAVHNGTVSRYSGRDGSKGRWWDIRRGVIERRAKQRVDPWRVVDVEGRIREYENVFFWGGKNF